MPGGLIAFVVTAMTIIAAQEAAVKLLTGTLSIWQLHILRSVMIVAMALIAARTIPWLGLRRLQRPGWAILRSALFSVTFLLLYLGLSFLTLAQSGAAFFTGPLFITLFAALFLKERIGARRLAALVLGFSGVLVTSQPWNEALDPAILFPLAAAFCYGLGVMVTRARLADESAVALQIVHHTLFGVLSILGLAVVALLPLEASTRESFPFLLTTWTALSAGAWLLVIANAVGNFVGALMLTHAYQRHPSSEVAPLEYSYLAVAPMLDLAIWQRVPGIETLIGIALVAAAGVFIARREGAAPRAVELSDRGSG